MTDLGPLIAHVLFWMLAVSVVFAPRRWAVLAFLVVIQIDLSGPGFASPSTVGIENAIKVLILPLVLLLRVGLVSVGWHMPRTLKLWLLFTAYVAFATLWSPFPVSAAKMVIYLASYAVTFVVFAEAWRRGLLDTNQIVAAVWISLALGGVQTYMLGNPFGTPPKLIIEQARFTTFAPPQSYAAFLVSCAALLLLARPATPGRRASATVVMTFLAIIVALVLVGSRYVAVGTLALLVTAAGIKMWNGWRERTMSRTAVVRAVSLGALALALLVGSVAAIAPNNRIFALRQLIHHGRLNPNAIGTFVWRLDAYQTAIDQIRARPMIDDVFGSGTSSGAVPVLEFNPTAFPANTIDANRALHNEYLRAFYEWGVIGSVLFVAFLVLLVIEMAQRTRQFGIGATQAFWGLLPTLLVGLLIENILAGSGTPVGTGFALVISCAAATTAPEMKLAVTRRAYSTRPQLVNWLAAVRRS